MANYLGKNHSVYFDNFFSSVTLAEDLLKEKTTCCGTIPPNKKGWPMPNTSRSHARLVKALIATIEPNQPVRRAPDAPTNEGSFHPYRPGHSLGKMPRRKRWCFQCAQDGVKMASGRTRVTITECHLCNVYLHGGACYAKFHHNLKS
ncbi:PiggyBac transposable element-derived protein 4-like [Plakobranchus ocellatus]|uniref:PiggyBac transposable element-derived protein 4-like n=1 Tax=Plakobranchus ocellatus TaxID=259542 RepID=A0AAV4AJ33_9GAST|nr:PiggyBac transposable element-derived protein 4-like [Plakobranchus ocellatus]